MEVNPNSKASVEFDLTRPLVFTRSAITDNSKASVEFDLTRPLVFTRSAITDNGNGGATGYIYSKALDGFNGLAVAKVSIANVCGLSKEQEFALAERIADEIVAPSFSDDEIEDIAFEIMDCEGIHSSVCDHHRDRARALCENITTRRRLALSGAR